MGDVGYLERQAWRAGGSLFSMFIVLGVAALFFAWPIVLLSPPDGRPWDAVHVVVAAFLELVWLGCLVAYFIYRGAKQQAQQQQDAVFRQQMSVTNTPWFDSRNGHYRHGTCTIRHRTEGAAARCRGTI